MANNEYDFVWWARDGASHLRQSGCREHADAIVVVCDRIRELEAELQVRDDMGNEVLRILREATGKRDFHSEMEAAEWSARMILDLQTQLFLEKQSSKEAMSREAAAVSREIGLQAELAEARRDAARLDYVLSHTEGDSVIGDVSAEGFWDDMEAEHIGDEREHLRAWRRAIDSALEAK